MQRVPASWQQARKNAEAAYKRGDAEQAIQIYLEGVAQGVSDVSTWETLGGLYLHTRQYAQAELWLTRAWKHQPSLCCLEHRVMALAGQGELVQAYRLCKRAHQALPTWDAASCPLADALYCVGGILIGESGAPTNSDGFDPQVEAWQRLGDWLFQAEQMDGARQAYEQSLSLEDSAVVWARLGHIHRFNNALSKAVDCLRQAVALDPENPTYSANLANAQQLTGDIDEGLALLKVTSDQHPDHVLLHSNALFAAHYSDRTEVSDLAAAHRAWGDHFKQTPRLCDRMSRSRDPQRRLRIGYISADFRRHSVAYTFEPVVQARDAEAFEVFGYGSVACPDAVTERLQGCFDHYRDIYSLSDEAAAQRMVDDKIDILVAVAGHSFGHRLGVLSHKPAPIQVDYQGINTTGLAQVDYRFTDHLQTPEGHEQHYTETAIYLDSGIHCFTPPQEAPPVNNLPILKNETFTFGSCNGLQKFTDTTLRLWAEVLLAVPASRLLIKSLGAEDAVIQASLCERFHRMGIGLERLEFVGWQPEGSHLAVYHRIDLLLDTFPFNGCITTLEGLWMGVPTLSLQGPLLVSRAGLSLMTTLDMAAFVAATSEQYVARACALAAHPDMLSSLRTQLRTRMRVSPLCDPATHVRGLEAGYRAMWQRYTEEGTSCP